MSRPTVIVAAVLSIAVWGALPASASAAIAGANLLPFAGTGTQCASGTTPCGDGGPATAAQLANPKGVAVMPDGAVIVADTNTNRIRRIGPDGTITTVAGNGAPGFNGDVGALTASLSAPQGVAVIDADSFLIADTGNRRVRRVDGTAITTVAGDGTTCIPSFACGDGGLATVAQLEFPTGIATRDGGATFLVTDRSAARVRRVDSGGVISTVAGTGTFCAGSADACGDGGPSAAADLYAPQGISLLPGDGFVIADPVLSRVRRVSRDDGAGTIERVAGLQASDAAGYTGDGGPASGARLNSPDGVAAIPSGGFAIADTTNNIVRVVDAAGIIQTAAGDGKACTPTTAACGDGGPASAGQFTEPRGIALDGRGDLIIADSSTNRVRVVDLPASVSPPTNPPPGTAATPETPTVGKTVLVQTLRGRVFVRPKGSRRVVPLDQVTLIPDGSKIDTRRGTARLTVATRAGGTDSADLSQGILRVDQRAAGTLVDIRLAEQITGCPVPIRDPGANGAQSGVKTLPRRRRTARTAAALLGPRTGPLAFASRARASAKRKRRTRRGRVRADGRFRTDGRYGSAVVRGTQWITIDDCRRGRRAQTRVVVREGRVGVRDFARARTTLVRKGQRYVAFARRG
jgi:hypothetical protein